MLYFCCRDCVGVELILANDRVDCDRFGAENDDVIVDRFRVNVEDGSADEDEAEAEEMVGAAATIGVDRYTLRAEENPEFGGTIAIAFCLKVSINPRVYDAASAFRAPMSSSIPSS